MPTEVTGFYFMKMLKGIKKSTGKIIAATTVVIFTLFATVFATYAWFNAALVTKMDNDEFEVVRISSGSNIESVNLIKFEYPINSSTHEYDYSRGKDGVVKRYTLVDGVFTDELGNTTTVLTTYDPAEKIVLGDAYSLFNSNCQAFYEITLTSENSGNFLLNTSSVIKPGAQKETERDIFLSDCVDFCFFTVSDIGNPIGMNPDTEKPYFYPTYIDYNSADPSGDMTDLENLYYRLSYQASIKTQSQLAHFYPVEEDDSKISNVPVSTGLPVTFSEQNPTYTLYIGVNYAPTELKQYYKDIYLSDIKAIYDYTISFALAEVVNP